MKLGGWHRLWIFLSIIYLFFIVFFTIDEGVPNAKDIKHSNGFYAALPTESYNMINKQAELDYLPDSWSDTYKIIPDDLIGDPQKIEDYKEKYKQRKTDTATRDRNVFAKYYNQKNPLLGYSVDRDVDVSKLVFVIPIRMANGHTIMVNSDCSQEQIRAIKNQYWDIVCQKAKGQRWGFLMMSLLFWIVPCLLIYGCAWAIFWVYRGFKPNRI